MATTICIFPHFYSYVEKYICFKMDTSKANEQRGTAEVVRGQVFEVGPRYHTLSYIGEGAYGMVV